jgi:hypothetical protein
MAKNAYTPSDRTKTLVAIIIVLVSIVVSTFYGVLSYVLGKPGEGFTAISYGIIFTLLLSCLGILFDLTYSLNSVRTAAQSLISLVDNRRVLDAVKENKGKLVQIERHLSGDQQGSDKAKKISTFPDVIQETAERTFNDYLSNFLVLDDGFKVEGEDWSLRSYYFFWECLLEEQNKRKGGEEGLVVRITHSNSIRIWLSENTNSDVSKLLTLQKAFNDAGGRIARVFLGNEPKATSDYERVLKRMRNSKLDAFYLRPESNTLPYDFLWVADLDFVVKWYSGAGGESLGSCEISKVQESAARELRSRWASIWRQLTAQKESMTPFFTSEVESIYTTE